MKNKIAFRGAVVLAALLVSHVQAQTRLTDPIPDPIEVGSLSVGLHEVVSGLAFPTDLEDPGDQTGRLFVAELGQPGTPGGKIKIIENNTVLSTPFLDLTTFTNATPDSFGFGLTGLAFHPGFADPTSPGHGKLYTVSDEVAGAGTAHFGPGSNHQSVLYEWRVSDSNPNVADTTPREILRIDQPRPEHNMNDVAFGSDGLLYVALGDGGGGGNTSRNAQNVERIFGSILRIDVDDTSGNGRYSIPDDNPFANSAGNEVKEIYAYGLRNPYRLSFDQETHLLYVADVGENDIEEINRIELGKNYGWNLKEGSFPFHRPVGGVTDDVSILPANFVSEDPIGQYDHDEGSSITGGFVYRGSMLPQLVGRYVFGDFGNGRLFHMDLDTGEIQEFSIFSNGIDLPSQILGFGQDADTGELYVFGTDGRVLQLVPEPTSLAAMATLWILGFRGRRLLRASIHRPLDLS